ncbi:nucleoside triphosphate pyrophosphohydrolase [Lentimicrobium sp.]|jgi:XTP/dITP diphosphohydrolase|uniref:nucleoside triphosphate pyrophosphohydrolase n=1 Tax=Lentimicrobium sp. TaxID=2034841 RepID=UPI0025D62EBD|nr:nucleoside triphosphate pyrophosphohydrolase [Lentimicrobium sp.]MCO5257768.1 nucleoside triphosphate pyrophosphohydrolase [Lentimicrobium sp.]HOP12972.1 nucleoside triphosphate pyrophosphohydrolase [Lentimicrobium sp.]HPF63354.1 nucleoside triphosphate pyrophosphohydrolase [Lentimicrobium sp.]HPJ62193.1 nucleoside triphosphate pyrophosphohydrolase [Lentimicrobium sp.]HPR25801.1 nucleoside triphosphate pyrophosphohydrolase [Lentimicrobium sp.]
MDPRLAAFERLLTIMDELRAGCPWDRKQTIESLRYLTIEETYELSDAILEKDMDEIKKELGDLMLHLVFYSKIASEQNAFTITDVLNGICEKLIHRHPHIYGDVMAKDAEAVKNNWEKIKLKEGERKTVLGGVPASLPAMVKAYRIQEKARGVGFDWDHVGQVWEKVQEELAELQYEKLNGSPEKIEDEFGDLLFALINYARFIDVNPEDALERTNKKFIRRFNYIEQKVNETGKSMHDMSLAELDVFWNEAKAAEVRKK